MIGNGKCDIESNVDECGWDGGDCLEEIKKYPCCSINNKGWIGDGICDGLEYNTSDCGWDGGDCLKIAKIFFQLVKGI